MCGAGILLFFVALWAAKNDIARASGLEYDQNVPERKAMTRLKDQIHKIYKLNYEGLKMIMENQLPNTIPITAEVENDLRI